MTSGGLPNSSSRLLAGHHGRSCTLLRTCSSCCPCSSCDRGASLYGLRPSPCLCLCLCLGLHLSHLVAGLRSASETIRGFCVNFPFFRFAGRITRSVARNTTSVTPHLPHPGLGVPIHDREARVPFLPRLLVHLTSSPFSKLIGIDDFLAQLCVVRKVIGSVVTSCVA